MHTQLWEITLKETSWVLYSVSPNENIFQNYSINNNQYTNIDTMIFRFPQCYLYSCECVWMCVPVGGGVQFYAIYHL